MRTKNHYIQDKDIKKTDIKNNSIPQNKNISSHTQNPTHNPTHNPYMIDTYAQNIIDSYVQAFWKITNNTDQSQIAADFLSLLVMLQKVMLQNAMLENNTNISSVPTSDENFDNTPVLSINLLFMNLCMKSGNRQQKTIILESIFKHMKFHFKTELFLRNIMQNGHLSYLIHILSAYHTIWDHEHNSIPASITTAHPISETKLTLLENELTKIHNRKVKITNYVKPKHIGGAILLIKGTMLDLSYTKQLKQLQTQFQSMHIHLDKIKLDKH